MKDSLAPLLLFTYKKLDTLKQTVSAIQKNHFAKDTTVFIFSDGPKFEKDSKAVNEVRKFIHSIQGFKDIIIVESPVNKGLANSIIDGVTKIINAYDKVIVVEDDLKLTPNFLTFMNESLNFYENDPRVFSVSGFIFNMPVYRDYKYDIFFTRRHCSWGWAMWKDRWNEIDWSVQDFPEFMRSENQQKSFNELGSDLTDALIRQQKGEINSWAIRCNYHQFKKQSYTVYPVKSKVDNIGFGEEATHTVQRFNRYKTTLESDPKYDFMFPNRVFEDELLLRNFNSRYSRSTRIYYYVLNKLFNSRVFS